MQVVRTENFKPQKDRADRTVERAAEHRYKPYCSPKSDRQTQKLSDDAACRCAYEHCRDYLAAFVAAAHGYYSENNFEYKCFRPGVTLYRVPHYVHARTVIIVCAQKPGKKTYCNACNGYAHIAAWE